MVYVTLCNRLTLVYGESRHANEGERTPMLTQLLDALTGQFGLFISNIVTGIVTALGALFGAF